MARFVFRLQRVKQVRIIQEAVQKQKWAQAQRALLLAQQKLAQLKEEEADVAAYCHKLTDIRIRPWAYRYLAKLDRMITRQAEAVHEAALVEAAARQDWNRARTEKENSSVWKQGIMKRLCTRNSVRNSTSWMI